MRWKRVCSAMLGGLLLVSMLTACQPGQGASSSTSSGDWTTSSSWEDSLQIGDDVTSPTTEFNNVPTGEDAPTPGETEGQGTAATDPDDREPADGNGDFSNTSSGQETPTPGDPSSGGGNESQPPREEEDRIDGSESLLRNEDALAFYYEGDHYAYGITAEGVEVIAFMDSQGNKMDVLAGAGRYSLKSTTGLTLIEAGGVSDFTQGISGTNISLDVTYQVTGLSTQNATIRTTYVFYDKHIGVEARVSYTSPNYTISSSNSRLMRTYMSGYTDTERKYNFEWVYPENGDYPYRQMESWITVNRIDEKHKVYTYLRGNTANPIPDKYFDFYNRYPETQIPLFFDDGTGIDYTAVYDLVLDTESEDRNSDYLALFESQGYNYAAGIAPVTPNDDASTVFVGDSVQLNMNVTNLTDRDVQFSARYDVRDYYGNVVAAGIFENSTVFANLEANRRITIQTDNNYGIFYLNFMVLTKQGSEVHPYRETYPFMIIPEYTYTYNETSPFGINQILGGPTNPYKDYLNVAGKIGVAITRGASNLSESWYEDSIAFLQDAQSRGIRVVASGYQRSFVQAFGDYVDEFIAGNELNLPTISEGVSIDQAFSDYRQNYFDLGYNIVKEEFGKKHVTAGISGGQAAWYDKLATVWEQFDIVGLHVYGFPYSPDLPTSSSQIWHVEDGLERNEDALQKYGWKPTYVNECGYPTVPGNATAVGLRTQADYNVRTYILALAHGVQAVMAYCWTDFSNSGVGADAGDEEYHFGHFYFPDYFGRIMPKPSAAAFSAMTRQLESVVPNTETYQGTTINGKYDEGDAGTVRAFTVETQEHGDVLVAWSNCSRLSNDEMSTGRPARTPGQPWEDQWQRSENVTFDATSTTVEVRDIMGNTTRYQAENGRVVIPLNGSPVFIYGVS